MADVQEDPVDVPLEDPGLDEVAEDEVFEEEEEFVAVGGAAEVKLFGKWSFDDIEVRDISLVVRKTLDVHTKCGAETESTKVHPCLRNSSIFLIAPPGLHCLQG